MESVGPRSRRGHAAGALRLVLPTLVALTTVTPVAAQSFTTRPARGLRYTRRVMHMGTLHATVHALYVDLCDPAVELRATAPNEGGRTTAAWARLVGATAAVNGDYFAMARNVPLGAARGHGLWWPAGAREHRDALFVAGPGGRAAVLDAPDDGSPALWRDAEATLPATWTEVVAVRERLLVHGAVRESPAVTHDGTRHPRTALGLTADGHTLMMVVVEGRAESATGATVRELALLLRRLGAWEGMKLDGGGSSTMFVAPLGTVNHPSDGVPRAVATHLGVIVQRAVPADTPSRCPVR